jgi:hypothetical protein
MNTVKCDEEVTTSEQLLMREAGRRTAVVMEIENSFGWNRRNAPSIVFAIAWFFIL